MDQKPQLPFPDPNDLGAIGYKLGAQLGAVLVELTAAQHLLMKVSGEKDLLQRQYDSAMEELEKLRAPRAPDGSEDSPGVPRDPIGEMYSKMNGVSASAGSTLSAA
jgi:hypothetical protein